MRSPQSETVQAPQRDSSLTDYRLGGFKSVPECTWCFRQASLHLHLEQSTNTNSILMSVVYYGNVRDVPRTPDAPSLWGAVRVPQHISRGATVAACRTFWSTCVSILLYPPEPGPTSPPPTPSSHTSRPAKAWLHNHILPAGQCIQCNVCQIHHSAPVPVLAPWLWCT